MLSPSFPRCVRKERPTRLTNRPSFTPLKLRGVMADSGLLLIDRLVKQEVASVALPEEDGWAAAEATLRNNPSAY